MKFFFRFTLLALMLVVVALLSAVAAMRFAIHGQVVQVPSVIGMTPAEAERAVTAAGLQLEIERQFYSAQVAEGHVMLQVPSSGTKVRRGWQVRVAESIGPQRVAIPDVTKQSERAAEWNIRRRGLDVASTAAMQMLGIPADQVLAQSPLPNASGVAAPKISLLLTAPTEPPAYVMPSFVGQPLGTVSRTLQDAGFKLGLVTMAPPVVPSGNVPPAAPAPASSAPPQPSPASVIVVQSPAAGQKILAGATVNFEVR